MSEAREQARAALRDAIKSGGDIDAAVTALEEAVHAEAHTNGKGAPVPGEPPVPAAELLKPHVPPPPLTRLPKPTRDHIKSLEKHQLQQQVAIEIIQRAEVEQEVARLNGVLQGAKQSIGYLLGRYATVGAVDAKGKALGMEIVVPLFDGKNPDPRADVVPDPQFFEVGWTQVQDQRGALGWLIRLMRNDVQAQPQQSGGLLGADGKPMS